MMIKPMPEIITLLTPSPQTEESMKISELVKRTGVPKETIHFYIREGLLRKPRKSGLFLCQMTTFLLTWPSAWLSVTNPVI
jgi:DNA-binding IclR family transcriptional regulator